MDNRQVILGTITLNIPIRCPLDVLGEGFHTEIGEIAVKLGLPEQQEGSELLEAPAIASRYGIGAIGVRSRMVQPVCGLCSTEARLPQKRRSSFAESSPTGSGNLKT